MGRKIRRFGHRNMQALSKDEGVCVEWSTNPTVNLALVTSAVEDAIASANTITETRRMVIEPTLDAFPTEFDEQISRFFTNAVRYGPPKMELMFHGLSFGLWDRTNRIYEIRRNMQEHFFRMWQSYGVSEAILRGLRGQNVEAVRLVEKGKTGTQTYVVNINKFFHLGLRHVNEVWPNEPQLHVPLREWSPLTGRWKLKANGAKEWTGE